MTATRSVTPYEEHGPVVLRVLAQRCRWLDPGDREAMFHDAYAVMLEKQSRGELEELAPHQVRAYLIQTALYKALDESRRAARRYGAPLVEEALSLPDPGEEPDEVVASSLDNDRLREIVAELPERQQTIVKLRFFFERTPGEIQRFLGITERTYRKDLERALKQVATAYQHVREGDFCDGRRSVILAYVAGIAGDGAAARARRHLESCPGCAHWAAQLREAAQQAAALVPPLPLAFSEPWWGSLRESLDRIVGTVKHQVASWTSNVDAATSQYAAGVRPGAVAAAVAGCLAIGSGATYCVTNGVPNSFLGVGARHEQRASSPRSARNADSGSARRRRAAAPARTVAASTPAPTAQASRTGGAAGRRARATSSRSARHRSTPKRRPLKPDDEFGFEGAGGVGTSGSAGSGSRSGVPTASTASAGGRSASGGGASPRPRVKPGPPGEFDP